ncbi:flagellar basal body rod C-terminal domain-containing protein [Candidatus Neomarinimicrobiota bacterium]
MIEEHRSFQANAAVVHTADEVLGSIIDLIV